MLIAVTVLAALALPTVSYACVGDCNRDGAVTVDELIVGVNIALGTSSPDQCQSLDDNRDRSVTIDEILTAVNASLSGCAADEARLLVLSREGRMASIDIASPWTVRATADLAAPIVSARCRAGRCVVVHASVDAISVVAARDLSLIDSLVLSRGSDPRDVAFVDDGTVVVSQYGKAELLAINLATHAMSAVGLSALADDDGLPEALRLASCGRRVFVQLRRVDHKTEAMASIGAGLAVVDIDASGRGVLVDADPDTRGVQGIALAGRPNFDMPVDCGAGVLYVAEPAPLMQGGGGYEQVDLTTLRASDLPIDTGAEVGGFEFVGGPQFWLITHTEFGPGPSSHLNLIGGGSPETHNTFALEHVNDLAYDAAEDILFYPDPCFTIPANSGCDPGVVPFHAHSGLRASTEAIDVGFLPIEVTVAR